MHCIVWRGAIPHDIREALTSRDHRENDYNKYRYLIGNIVIIHNDSGLNIISCRVSI